MKLRVYVSAALFGCFFFASVRCDAEVLRYCPAKIVQEVSPPSRVLSLLLRKRASEKWLSQFSHIRIMSAWRERNRWSRGYLKVCLVQGDRERKSFLSKVANRWFISSKADGDFDFGLKGGACAECPKCHIRVGFEGKGNWSFVGNEHMNPRLREQTKHGVTMNLEVLKYGIPDKAAKKEVIRIILHEFGHALGLLHEQRRPHYKCSQELLWETEVIPFYTQHYAWKREQVVFRLRTLFERDLMGRLDPLSVMIVYFPTWMLKKKEDSPCYAMKNGDLSDGDKQVIRKLFPGGSSFVLGPMVMTPRAPLFWNKTFGSTRYKKLQRRLQHLLLRQERTTSHKKKIESILRRLQTVRERNRLLQKGKKSYHSTPKLMR